jgi:diguanylate cyclase (GGDEF)-like protein/PAS domain S-box-containing protein
MLSQLLDSSRYAFNPYAIPTFLVVGAILFLAGVILLREGGTPVSGSFFVFAVATSLWLFGFSWMYCATDERIALLWAKTAFVGVSFIPSTLYHFSIVVLRAYRRRKVLVWTGWATSILFSVLSFTSTALVDGLYQYRWGYYPKAGRLSVPFLTFFFGLLILSFLEYILSYRNASPGTQKLRASSLMTAYTVGYLGCLDYVAWYGIPLYPFGYLPIFAFLALLVRTIKRHRLVDITPSFAAREIVATMPDPLIVCDAEGKIRVVNPAACSIFGYTESELLGGSLTCLVEPGSENANRLCDLIQRGKSWDQEMVFRTKSGQSVDISLSISNLQSPDLRSVGMVVIGRDIRERKRSEEELKNTLSLLSATLESTADGILVIDREEKMVSFNQKFVTMWRIPPPLMVAQDGSTALNHVLDQLKDPDGFRKKVKELNAQAEAESYDLLECKDERFYECYSQPQRIAGRCIGRVWSFRDITEKKQAQERLHYLAAHDPLTNLPNRTLLFDRLGQAISRVDWHRRLVAVLFMDLDRFKVINDTLGHSYGDRLLKAVGNRLSENVRGGDTVARLGGDEFVVVLADIARAEDVPMVIKKILDSLSLPFGVEAVELFITASVGVSLYPNDGEDPVMLLKNADAAMYRAKEQGGNNYQFYSPDMNVRIIERLALETDLRRALEREEFLLHYQPQVDLETGRIIGMEALVRWKKPDLGLVSPAKFIPLAEETGLILPIGEWVLRRACEQNKSWQEAGLPPIRIAVNLSARQFQQENLAMTIGRVLQETGLDSKFIELELTESLLMKKGEITLSILRELNKMGLRLSIDDFGTGYSSLSYLTRFPIHELKIDKSFVLSVTVDSNNAVVARAIVTMAHGLGLKALAEGVETQEQLDFLRSIRCDEAQGYLFSRPLPTEEATKLLAEGKAFATSCVIPNHR